MKKVCNDDPVESKERKKVKYIYAVKCNATGRYFSVQMDEPEDPLHMTEVELYVGNVSRFSYNNSIRQSMN